MINSSKKKHWKIRAQRIELCLFLSIWLYIYAQKKFSLGEKFLIKVVFMNERLNMYVSKQTHCSRKIDAYRLIDSKNKKNKILPSPHMLKPNSMSSPWVYITIYYLLLFSYVGFKDFHHFKTTFKWTHWS